MTIIDRFEKKCAVCGKTSLQQLLSSTSTWGYPDLDLRPIEMKRSSMSAWLEECPCCGYVASNIENRPEVPDDFLKSDDYLSCEGNDFKSNLAKRFYKHHMISKTEKDYESEFFSLLHCAWICDDNDDELAVKMRKMALEAIDKIASQSDEEKTLLILIKSDLLRRTGQFEEVIHGFKDLILEDKLQNDVVSLQIELDMKEDSDCHTVEEAVKN